MGEVVGPSSVDKMHVMHAVLWYVTMCCAGKGFPMDKVDPCLPHICKTHMDMHAALCCAVLCRGEVPHG